VTARAATALAAAGIDLGRVVALGTPPEGVEAVSIAGELVRFEGEGRLAAVVVRDPAGVERRHSCDTASLGLGLAPRDTLFRMGRDLPGVRVVGDAARPADLPPCPSQGTVCPCAGVEVADLESAWERGFQELELVKRATLAGTGTCQGSVCLPHVRSFLAARGGELQPPFTARPVTRQLTLGEIASGAWPRATPRTPLHQEHLRLGARMERSGGWWRPWSYGDARGEYRAVRHDVSLGDVSTLGKFVVSGPDAERFLEHLYPTRIGSLRPGRARYALLLDERGYLLDDGLVCRDADTRFTLTLTSAGSTFGELWLRDWAESLACDVRIMNRTLALGAVNVTGPRAPDLLARAGLGEPPGFLRHARAVVAGVDCHVIRLSFTGEISYELHHAAADSAALWRRLLALGADLGVRPHGLGTLFDLRLEKGHIVVGQDTDYDSTPRRLRHEWAVALDKEDFIGRAALRRTNAIPLDRLLVGLEMAPPAPAEGEIVEHDGRYAGYVTSSCDSEALGRAVMLAWLELADGELPDEVTVAGRPARRVPTPFYDPEGARARAPVEPGDPTAPRGGDWRAGAAGSGAEALGDKALLGGTGRFEVMEATRIVARPEALDEVARRPGVVLRIAADELVALEPIAADSVADPHAILARESGFSGLWLSEAEAAELLARACAWEPPAARPATAQGALADIAVKLHFSGERVLLLVPTPYAADLEERLG
jgi:glycine cleavage system aminomethyltransferase T